MYRQYQVLEWCRGTKLYTAAAGNAKRYGHSEKVSLFPI